MMVLYEGTPGSGKSYHMALRIWNRLRVKKSVISNFDINLDNVSLTFFSYLKSKFFKSKNLKYKNIGKFTYKDNEDLTVEFLVQYAMENHNFKNHEEGQTLILIDEASILFNSRSWDNKNRMKWIKFLGLHRHYGYDIILATQSERMIDKQIRSFIEYNLKHRKLNNYKAFGKLLGVLSGGCLFIVITNWCAVKEKVSSETLRYSKRIASIYDTFMFFEDTPKLEIIQKNPVNTYGYKVGPVVDLGNATEELGALNHLQG